LTFGLVIFGTGSLASALSGSAGVLIATRAFMGIGGAFIMPSTLSIISNVFTDPLERGKAIGIWAGVSALGVGIGPVAGGFLLSHFYWGSVFFVNLPIVAVALLGGWFLVPNSRDPSAPKLDPLGALLSMVGLATLLWAVIEAPSHGWGSNSILTAFAAAAVVLGLFVYWELHSSSPMLDMRFFRNPRFSAASGAITVTFFTLFGSLFLLTQYLQSVLGFSPLKAGAMLVPEAVVMMIGAPLSSTFVQKVGNKFVVTGGLLAVGLAMAMFSRLGVHATAWQVCLVTMTLGLGMSQVFAPATDSIMGSLPKEKAGVGSAMNDTTRQTGGAVGVAVLGSLLASRFHSNVSKGASALPQKVSAAIHTDLNTALAFSHTAAGRPYQVAIGNIARGGFVNAFHFAVLLGAGFMAIAAIGVAMWLPHRPPEEEAVIDLPEVVLEVA
jgi:EmrB/QacA subfamily drug resistance transporter